MTEPSPRMQEIFFEVYEELPRQGPGNRACAERALALCRLPPAPAVLDVGCGVGGQTLHLAELTAGVIAAADTHAPAVRRLRRAVSARRLTHRILPVVGDMASPPFASGRFDLIWSEGAFYNLGIETALRVCRPLLQPGGHVAFSDVVWRKADPPPDDVRTVFAEYPAMGLVADVVATIERSGFDLQGHFTLPDEAWWDDFYTPMLGRVDELRRKYATDDEALAALDEIGGEPRFYRRHSEYYAYEFFVARRGV